MRPVVPLPLPEEAADRGLSRADIYFAVDTPGKRRGGGLAAASFGGRASVWRLASPAWRSLGCGTGYRGGGVSGGRRRALTPLLSLGAAGGPPCTHSTALLRMDRSRRAGGRLNDLGEQHRAGWEPRILTVQDARRPEIMRPLPRL